MLTPKIKRTFTGSRLRAVTDADDDNAKCHSTITRATYRQLIKELRIALTPNEASVSGGKGHCFLNASSHCV